MQQAQRDILKLIPEMKAKATLTPVTPNVESVTDRPVQGVTSINVENLSVTRQPISVAEEPATLFTCSDIEALIKQEKTSLGWKPPYPSKVVMKPYPLGYKVPTFPKYDGRSGNSKENVVLFLESTSCHSNDTDLSLKEFSKSQTDRAYTWDADLKPGMVHD